MLMCVFACERGSLEGAACAIAHVRPPHLQQNTTPPSSQLAANNVDKMNSRAIEK